MKSILTLFFLIPVMLFSQENNNSNDSIIEHPDQEASFPGGPDAMQQYIADNIEYPPAAMKSGKQGRVFVEFVVNTDGSISDVKILRGVSEALDNESVRIINTMPNWVPAQLGDENVRARCRVPFNFKLDPKANEPDKSDDSDDSDDSDGSDE